MEKACFTGRQCTVQILMFWAFFTVPYHVICLGYTQDTSTDWQILFLSSFVWRSILCIRDHWSANHKRDAKCVVQSHGRAHMTRSNLLCQFCVLRMSEPFDFLICIIVFGHLCFNILLIRLLLPILHYCKQLPALAWQILTNVRPKVCGRCLRS